MEAVKSKIVNRAAIAHKPAASVKQVQRQVVTNRSSVQVQASTKVSSPNDAAEKEADTTSKKIMRMAIPESSIAYVKTASGGLFRQVKQEEKEKKIQTKLRSPYISRFANSGIFTQRKPEETIHRKADGQSTIAPSVSADIQNSMSSGSPLPMGVRRFMEPRFRADFSKVKIHTGDKAAKLNKQVNAQAFAMGNHVFFGKNKFQPDSHEGKELIAHELTHTIQQGEVVQRSEDIAIAQQSPPQIQRLGLSDALDYFADKANLIPGFRMFTIVLGVNPINMNSVDRSAANIMRAIVEFIPGGGFITQALDNHGVFEKVGNWVEQQIKTLGMVGSSIKQAVTQFLDSLGWRDIFDLGGVWNRAKSIFTDPINRIISFAKGLITGILKFVKDAILKPLAALAQGTRGYDLLKAILGEDPVTGEAVPRNADTLIGGFMKLIGQEEVWENIKKGKAIERAWAWFQGALAGLMGLVRAVPAKIISTITSLTIQDIVTVAGAFTKIVSAFANIATDFIGWGIKQVISLLEIIFSVVAPGVMPYIKKAQAAFMTIIKNPIAFVGNLVKAGKQGFQMFASNILEHLKAALIKWITGPLGEAGVYIPQSFSLIEIVKLVLSVLGLTWQNIRSKLVKIIPEPVLVGLEKTAGILVTLVKDGPAAAWEQIKSELSELKDQMIAQVTQMISTEVVKAAITKLVSMLNPAGAVIQAIIATYNTVTFFIEKINQIAAVVAAFIDSISAIANGEVGNAAKKVETTMANTLTIVIAFLAKFAGLGNIPNKVVGIVKKIRAPIDKGLDKIVGWLGKMLEKAKTAVVQAGVPQDPNERLKLGMQAALTSARSLGKINESLLRPVLSGIKVRYGFQFLDAFKRNNTWWIRGKVNPGPNEVDTGKGDSSTSDEKILKMDNGSLSEEQRKTLLDAVINIVVNSTVIDNIFKIMKGGNLISLLEEIKSRNLQNGFKIVTKPQGSNAIIMSYHGLFNAGGSIKYGTVKIGIGESLGERNARGKKHMGIAEIKGELLKLDFNVNEKVKSVGVKGVGTAMFKIAQSYFAGRFSKLEGLWVYNPALYRNPRGESENLTTFWAKFDAGGSSLEDAAWATFTGTLAKKQKYDVVKIIISTRKQVKVEFSKSPTIDED